MMAVHGVEAGEVSYETDRMRFIGRGNTVADPQALSGRMQTTPGPRALGQRRARCSIRSSLYGIA